MYLEWIGNVSGMYRECILSGSGVDRECILSGSGVDRECRISGISRASQAVGYVWGVWVLGFALSPAFWILFSAVLQIISSPGGCLTSDALRRILAPSAELGLGSRATKK